MSRSLVVFGCQEETDIQMYNAHSLFRLIGRLLDPLLASKWIQLLEADLAIYL